MNEVKNNQKHAAAPAPAKRFSKPVLSFDVKRALATRRLFTCLIVCMVLWTGIYTAQATGDMSTRLAQGLSAVVLAVGSFYAGTWKQFMWPKEG